MTRETKAERIAREAQERFARQEKLAESWPTRLLALLERAQYTDFELRIRDQKFVISDGGPFQGSPWLHNERELEFTLEHSDANEKTLSDLEWQVDSREEQLREAERQLQLKKSALSKLTDEERKVLGL